MPQVPKVSVVIAAYQPGDAFRRVIDSLDAQTLPQDEFEVVVIDDGSPDGTFERLTALAAARPNLRVERIENSGWPSRPRNVGVRLARGDYVFFMDHDDRLYPDALRRMAQYAAETRADVLSPKESKTSDAWWGLGALADGNIENAKVDGGIDRLLPMVPHKLYRRAFLLENEIEFPEGRRRFWEDIYVNVAAWRHAQRVAVLADTPAYLWFSSGTNNSKTYGPRTVEFWDRLDELFAFIDATLHGDAGARRSALLHHYRERVLLRLSRNLRQSTPTEMRMAMSRARAIQQQYVPEEWDQALGHQVRARAVLLRQGRADLMARLWTIDSDTSCRVTANEVRWEAGRLRLQVEAGWRTRDGRPVGLVRRAGRLVRDLPPELAAALPVDVIDLTDSADQFTLRLGVRDRKAFVTWPLALQQDVRWGELRRGHVTPYLTATALLDPAEIAFGRPLTPSVHDLVAMVRWDAAQRAGSVGYAGEAAPAILDRGTAVAYSTVRKTLALDASATIHNVLSDGGSRPGLVDGSLAALSVPLPRVAVFAPTETPASARLKPVDRGGVEYVLPGAVIADRTGAHLELNAAQTVPPGRYELALRLANGPFLGAGPARVVGRGLEIEGPASAELKTRHDVSRRSLPKGAADMGRWVKRRLRNHWS